MPSLRLIINAVTSLLQLLCKSLKIIISPECLSMSQIILKGVFNVQSLALLKDLKPYKRSLLTLLYSFKELILSDPS
jgi:hypothetical protein